MTIVFSSRDPNGSRIEEIISAVVVDYNKAIMMQEPVEKRFFGFMFNKRDRRGNPINMQLDVPADTREEAAETLKQLFASMIMDLNESYPTPKKRLDK